MLGCDKDGMRPLVCRDKDEITSLLGCKTRLKWEFPLGMKWDLCGVGTRMKLDLLRGYGTRLKTLAGLGRCWNETFAGLGQGWNETFAVLGQGLNETIGWAMGRGWRPLLRDDVEMRHLLGWDKDEMRPLQCYGTRMKWDFLRGYGTRLKTLAR